MVTRNLLRFAVTRQPVTHDDHPHAIPGPFWNGPGTVLQQALARADTVDAAAEIAAAYLASDRYVGAGLRVRPGSRAALAALPRLISLARAGDDVGLLTALAELTPDGPVAAIEPVAGTRTEDAGAPPPDRATGDSRPGAPARRPGAAVAAPPGATVTPTADPALPARPGAGGFEADLWDGYYAGTLVTAPPAQDVADLADLLRVGAAVTRAVPGGAAAAAAALTAVLVLPPWLFADPLPGSPAARGIRPAGVTDLLIIQDELAGYEQAEISYVENVLRTERKERTFRKLDRVYDSYTLSTENAEQTQRDLQSTTRSELQSEVNETATKDSSLTAGVGVSASYGPFVSVDTNVDASLGTSTETATSTSNSYAQDLVDRSVTTVSQRTVETVVHRTLSETEDTTVHGFSNEGPTDVVGYYRWLQQVWTAQVLNYGRRMILEVMVPQPAVLWRAARSSGTTAKVTREPPAPLMVEPPGLSESNYAGWAAEYGVTGLTPPPALTVWVNKVFEIPELEHQKNLSNDDFVVMTKSGYIEVPAGYVAVHATGDESKASWGTGAEQLRAHVGNSVLDLVDGPRDKTMSGLSGQVEVAVFLYDFKAATVDIKLECTRTDEAYAQWQLSAYEKIADAYQTQLDAYLAEVNMATTAETVTRAELSPDAKRRVELDELKRAALTIVSSSDFSHRNAVSGPTDAAPIPVTDPDVALAEGRTVGFWESVLEWVNAVYVFYPYFWGRQDTWYPALLESDPDPTFEAFLRAGSARLQVPVRPGFERALLWYLHTGKIWRGGEPPLVGDPYYLPIVEELAEATGMSLDQPVPYGEPWTYQLPTTLVAIDDDVSDLGL
jgi:hypothetical protein